MTLSPVPLHSIPYLDLSDLRGRKVMPMPFWDGASWHVWAPTNGGYLHLNPLDAAHSDYVADTAAKHDDLFVPFVDVM